MAAATPDASADPNGVKETLDQRLGNAQSKLALQSFSSLGIVDRDPQAVYFAYLSRAPGVDGEYMQACVMAMMTATKSRLVSYYLYSDYAKDPRSASLPTCCRKPKRARQAIFNSAKSVVSRRRDNTCVTTMPKDLR